MVRSAPQIFIKLLFFPHKYFKNLKLKILSGFSLLYKI